MYSKKTPRFTNGPFAEFYGGGNVTDTSSVGVEDPSIRIISAHHVAMMFSVVGQVTFLFFKWEKMRSTLPENLTMRRPTLFYETQLKNTLLMGFNNVYSIYGMLIFTTGIAIWMLTHYYLIWKQINKATMSIPVLFILLCGMNIMQFVKNVALRFM